MKDGGDGRPGPPRWGSPPLLNFIVFFFWVARCGEPLYGGGLFGFLASNLGPGVN